jgi:hypothetical protein
MRPPPGPSQPTAGSSSLAITCHRYLIPIPISRGAVLPASGARERDGPRGACSPAAFRSSFPAAIPVGEVLACRPLRRQGSAAPLYSAFIGRIDADAVDDDVLFFFSAVCRILNFLLRLVSTLRITSCVLIRSTVEAFLIVVPLTYLFWMGLSNFVVYGAWDFFFECW